MRDRVDEAIAGRAGIGLTEAIAFATVDARVSAETPAVAINRRAAALRGSRIIDLGAAPVASTSSSASEITARAKRSPPRAPDRGVPGCSFLPRLTRHTPCGRRS
jgi:hypothetical protein